MSPHIPDTGASSGPQKPSTNHRSLGGFGVDPYVASVHVATDGALTFE
ncbi:MAG: hypothetical protein ACRDZX_15185 [Acidimicrobiales bacterium]